MGGYTMIGDISWVKQTVNRRIANGHGYYLQHAKETCLVGLKGDFDKIRCNKTIQACAATSFTVSAEASRRSPRRCISTWSSSSPMAFIWRSLRGETICAMDGSALATNCE